MCWMRLCRKSCPVKAIDLQMKKPVWVKNECVMCLSVFICALSLQFNMITKLKITDSI